MPRFRAGVSLLHHHAVPDCGGGLGVTTVVRQCPSICFPQINIPVVVVATFYAGMAAATNGSRHYQHVLKRFFHNWEATSITSNRAR